MTWTAPGALSRRRFGRPAAALAGLALAALVALGMLPVAAASASAAPGATLASATASGTPAPSPLSEQPTVAIRLLDIPAATQDDPRARTYIVDNVAPGATIERRVEVTNASSTPQTVTVYVGAAEIVDGAFRPSPADVATELTSWMSVGAAELALGPGETAAVPVTIAVPMDAPEGEQYAAIWAQITSPPAEGSSVALASRAGVRVYLSVGPGNGPPADFEIGALTAGRDADGVPQVTAQVTNTGGRAVDVNASLALTDGPGSTSAGPFETASAVTIAPGGRGEIVVPLDPALADGPWQAELELTSGLLTKSVTAELTFPAAGSTTPVVADAGPPIWIIILIIALVAVALAIVAAVLLRARRPAGPPDPAAPSP